MIIRKYQTDGGIILTASHNPGGPDNDFGVKFNEANGGAISSIFKLMSYMYLHSNLQSQTFSLLPGPATETVTENIYKMTTTISSYRSLSEDLGAKVDLSKLGTYIFDVEDIGRTRPFRVVVIDSVEDYHHYMRELFDFNALRAMLSGSDGLPKVNIHANALHGGKSKSHRLFF